ncbi:MAG: recombinase family protein, partial [Pseudomonadota bacterium]
MPTRPVRRRGRAPKAAAEPAAPVRRTAVMYCRVSSRDQEREGFSIPAQQKLLREYAEREQFQVLQEFTDVETAKRTGRQAFTAMLTFLRRSRTTTPVILVEKTDRLYRNLKDWVTLDEMKVEVHFVKENIVIAEES